MVGLVGCIGWFGRDDCFVQFGWLVCVGWLAWMALLDCLVRLAGWFHFWGEGWLFGWIGSVVGWQVFSSFGMLVFSSFGWFDG